MPKSFSREAESGSHDINRGPHMKLQKDHIQARAPCGFLVQAESLRGSNKLRDLDIPSEHKMFTQQLYNHGRDGSYYNIFSREVLATFYTAQHDPI